jgi:DNA-binding PadR family transcriptional regulator
MTELLTKMIFGGFVRLHVLYHAAREPVFGVEMMEALGRHGYAVGPGTLYPILHQMEQAGYLTAHAEVVAGKQRKYYRATPAGIAALDAAKGKLRELVKEVLHDDPPTPSIRSAR